MIFRVFFFFFGAGLRVFFSDQSPHSFICWIMSSLMLRLRASHFGIEVTQPQLVSERSEAGQIHKKLAFLNFEWSDVEIFPRRTCSPEISILLPIHTYLITLYSQIFFLKKGAYCVFLLLFPLQLFFFELIDSIDYSKCLSVFFLICFCLRKKEEGRGPVFYH